MLQISAHIEKHGYLPGGLKVFVKFHICSSKSQPGLVCSILAEIQRGSTLEGGHIFAASLFVSQGRSFRLPAKFLGVLLGATTQLISLQFSYSPKHSDIHFFSFPLITNLRLSKKSLTISIFHPQR